MRLVRLTIFALACSAAGTTVAWGASRDIETSWGKAGVSLTQYRLDGGVCAARAITLDISGTPAAQRMVLASRAIDNAYASAWMYYPSASDGPVAIPSTSRLPSLLTATATITARLMIRPPSRTLM